MFKLIEIRSVNVKECIVTVVNYLLIGIAALVLQGCMSPPLVGDVADATPPKLIRLPIKDSDGKEQVIWDRPLAFGPVPSDLQALADQACMSARIDLMALGYHPFAQDLQGKTMTSGGYFCGLKPQGDKPDLKPPQLVRLNGQLGWNRPAAFGRIPVSEQARGLAMCQSAGSNLVPIGYHPYAQDESGKPIAGGGFFCAVR